MSNGFNSGEPKNTPAAAVTGNPQTPAGGTAPQAPKGRSILGGKAFFGSSTNNPTVSRAVEAIRNWLKEQGEDVLEIITIDGASQGLRMSGIALAYPWDSVSANKSLYLTQFILFEETLPERGNMLTTEVNNQQVQLTVTIDDWVTTDYILALQEIVKQSVRNQNAEVRTTGYYNVNRQVSATNDSTIYVRLAQQAGETFAQYIEYILGEQARSKNTIKDIINNRNLSLNVDTSGIQAYNIYDQPVRNDISLIITAKDRVEQGAGGLFDTGVIPLTETNAYIDVTYYEQTDAERLNSQLGTAQYDPAAQYRRFGATAVISEISSLRGIWEIDSIVNAMLSIVALNEGRQWAALLQRRYSNSSAARLRDVGYLALEVDPAAGVIDTSSVQYTEMQHAHLINTFFRNRLDFAIDLPRSSSYGFMRQLLRGSEIVGSISYNAFVKGLNEYTDGHFPLGFNAPILAIDPRPLLLGNYLGHGNGAARYDLRDYQDYLTILTQIGQTDIQTVKEFDAALAGVDGKTLEQRTTTVYNILERMAGDINLTGKADRYNLNPLFLETLVNACKAAKLSIQTRTVGTMATTATNRRSADAFGTAFGASGGVQNVFTSNQGSFGGGDTNVGGGLNLTFGLN